MIVGVASSVIQETSVALTTNAYALMASVSGAHESTSALARNRPLFRLGSVKSIPSQKISVVPSRSWTICGVYNLLDGFVAVLWTFNPFGRANPTWILLAGPSLCSVTVTLAWPLPAMIPRLPFGRTFACK
jgi:hypothetical protein